jgi:hypothetical protein
VARQLNYGNNPYAPMAAEADVSERVAFLRKVAGLTGVGLMISGATSFFSAGLILLAPSSLTFGLSIALLLGGMFGARMVGATLVRSESPAVAGGGFLFGTSLQGLAMGSLILQALMMSIANFGNPFVLLAEAAGLVALTVLGIVVYLLTGPKKLSMVGAFLSAVSLPMLVAMIASLIFPGLFGGIFGLIMNLLFVGVSAAGLLYALNTVMHTMSTTMAIPAAFEVTMGILTLFWNILTLLMRLQRR